MEMKMSKGNGSSQGPSDLGVIYLAFGRPFLAMGLCSIASIHRTNPQVPVCVVTNVCEAPPAGFPWREGFDHWTFVSRRNAENRLLKTAIYEWSPFEKTLYLDCDTVVVGDMSLMSFFLDYFDMAMRLTRGQFFRGRKDGLIFDGTMQCHRLPHWNGGVVAFRKGEPARDFFSMWNASYKKLGVKRDQPSLAETVFKSTCRVMPLDERWNNSDRFSGGGRLYESADFRDETVIWHYKTDFDGPLYREIIAADRLLDGSLPDGNPQETANFLMKRGYIYRFRPRALARSLIRRIRGRLPDRLPRAPS
jgi:hypothetical protein